MKDQSEYINDVMGTGGSNCCGAPCYAPTDQWAICTQCNEPCDEIIECTKCRDNVTSRDSKDGLCGNCAF